VLTPQEQLRADALAIFRAGVEAAEPARLVQRALQPETFEADRGLFRVVAFGKAACAMAEAAAAALPTQRRFLPGIVVTHHDSVRALEGFRVYGSGHPLPDPAGAEAASALEEYVRAASAEETVLVLVSGGGSAILPAPVEGITLPDKIALTDALLRSGADIGELNAVRKHLSRLKGGGLARVAFPARVRALLLSDVLGDDPSVIASGPTVPDPTTFAEVRDILLRRGVWPTMPPTVRSHIEQGLEGKALETPKVGNPAFERARYEILGSNALSLEAARQRATELGYDTRVATHELLGEAREAARWLHGQVSKIGEGAARPTAVLCGGETTVTVQGPGRGGRNQELALAFALEYQGASTEDSPPWAFLSAGTDGIDGPTDAAGGLVDAGTLTRAQDAGLTPQAALATNDSYPFLAAASDLILTGPTGTNVADLQVFLSR